MARASRPLEGSYERLRVSTAADPARQRLQRLASRLTIAIAAILALAIYGFRTTLAGRPLWQDELQRQAR
jgi:hypothetical protein